MIVWKVLALFAGLSLLALGGGSAIIPELQRQAVLEQAWLSDKQFVDFYALTQVTPGPSMMVVALVGFQAAGIPGALAAVLGMFGPSSALVLAVRGSWTRLRQSRWRELMERTTRPFAVGTMLASATLVARSTNVDGICWAITVAAAALVSSQRLGILPTMALAGAAGYAASFL
ncbi:chromate transporter [bacterium]|nr:chromate transporter [bacterium]